ncbi:MAG: ABC transporter permease [Treponema sp.]|jgi:peptide/nickel transport system permease protein|nr:ABC transporter permease [Treponema sp.]
MNGKAGRAGITLPLITLGVAAFFALFPGVLGPDALAQDLLNSGLPPLSKGHFLGTDALGRDVLKLTAAGTRSALAGPVCIAGGSLLIGVLLGSLAGWFGGPLDRIISLYTDLTLAMPSLLLAIVAAGIMGGGYSVGVAVLIALYSPFDIRLVRSAVISQKRKPYIEAAITQRLSPARILARHIFPNITLLILVNFFLNIAYGMVSMASLSFLGMGAAPGAPDWGRQLADGRALLFQNPASALSAGLAIILTAASINIMGARITEEKALPL